MAPDTAPRLLINLERVGDIGSRPYDVVHKGDCDTAVRQLCNELGWAEELENLWAETEGSVSASKSGTRKAKEKEKDSGEREEKEVKRTKEEEDAGMAAKVDALSNVIEARLQLIDDHVAATLADTAPRRADDPSVTEYEGHDDWDEYGLTSKADPDGVKPEEGGSASGAVADSKASTRGADEPDVPVDEPEIDVSSKCEEAPEATEAAVPASPTTNQYQQPERPARSDAKI